MKSVLTTGCNLGNGSVVLAAGIGVSLAGTAGYAMLGMHDVTLNNVAICSLYQS